MLLPFVTPTPDFPCVQTFFFSGGKKGGVAVKHRHTFFVHHTEGQRIRCFVIEYCHFSHLNDERLTMDIMHVLVYYNSEEVRRRTSDTNFIFHVYFSFFFPSSHPRLDRCWRHPSFPSPLFAPRLAQVPSDSRPRTNLLPWPSLSEAAREI